MAQSWEFLFGYTNLVVNGVIILIICLNLVVHKFRQLQEKQLTEQKNGLLSLYTQTRELCHRFSLDQIQRATSNFHDDLVIGKGGFGKVYKGELGQGTLVAIKRLESTSHKRSTKFRAKIEMLSKVRHSHLVSLTGYCDEGREMILVYEFMPGGSLADHLYKRVKQGDTSLTPLSWIQRLKICIGAARGLDYLHTGTGNQHIIIHRHVKTNNILLDENFAAKISDIGSSKIVPANQADTFVSTNITGTFGYLDPYYVETRRLTRKSDVYAFGVVLFEVLCGRPAVDTSLNQDQMGLARWAQHCYREGLLGYIIDPKIEEVVPDCLEAFVKVAIQCLHIAPKHRPNMTEVVVALESALALQEKCTDYSLPKIITSYDNQDDRVVPKGSHKEKQSSTRKTFRRRSYRVFRGFPVRLLLSAKPLIGFYKTDHKNPTKSLESTSQPSSLDNSNLLEIPTLTELLTKMSQRESTGKLPTGLNDQESLRKLLVTKMRDWESRRMLLSRVNDQESPRKFHVPDVSINLVSTANQDIWEIQLDFHDSHGTVFDITELLGLMGEALEYNLFSWKLVGVLNLKVIHMRNSLLPVNPNYLSFPNLEMLFLQSNLDLSNIPSSFFERMPALKVLDMSNTSIETLPPWVYNLTKLEELILQRCELLIELTHEIGALRNLRLFDLSGCTNLSKIPDLIDIAQSLSSLDLTNCKSLTKLPKSICKLRSLQNLNLSGCTNLAEIAESIELLEGLSSLDLTDCKSLTKLPESMCNMRSLKCLHLSGCSRLFEVPAGWNDPESPKKFHAPEVSINTLSTARKADTMEVQLDFHETNGTLFDITELLRLMEMVARYKLLKSNFVALVNLKVIHVRNSRLPQIPHNVTFPGLEMLVLQPDLDLSYIPSSFFERMPVLKVLDMSNTCIKTFPSWLYQLTKLEELILRRCELLIELPHEISTLGNLKVLDLEGTDLVCIPEELNELIELKCLKFSLYDAESYRKSKDIVSIIPRKTISKLTQLEELSINVHLQDVWCNAAMEAVMEDLPSLSELKILRLCLPTTELLQDLLELRGDNDLPIYQNLSDFNLIIGPQAQHFISRLPCDLEEEFLKLKKCLKYINGEDERSKFADALKHANALYLDRHWTIQRLSVFKFEDLTELKFCLLVDCNVMQTVFDESDFNLGAANNGDNLLSLQYLAIHYLKNLKEICKGPGAGCCLKSLMVLVVHMCPNLTTIFTPVLLADLVNLREITVEDCPKLTSLIGEDSTQLTYKVNFPRLKKLSLLYLPELVTISNGTSIGLELKNIVIYDCPKLKRLPSLGPDVIDIKGEGEWWNALEWMEPEWRGGQPGYLHSAFSELDMDGDSVDELAPQYGKSLHLFVEECHDRGERDSYFNRRNAHFLFPHSTKINIDINAR